MSALRTWLKNLFPKSGTRRSPWNLPQLEVLEDRTSPATFTVTVTGDNGDNTNPIVDSLRWAIVQANTKVGLDDIKFEINNGVQTISPQNIPLPTITEPVIIDGSAPLAFPTQSIVLNGANAGANANGLTIASGASTVRGLTIIGFSKAGVSLSGGSGNSVFGNYIGIDQNNKVTPNLIGIDINNSSLNTIGGPPQGNVISGNTEQGIKLVGSSGNAILGNYIGTNVDGTAGDKTGNGSSGIYLLASSTQNTIGGTSGVNRNIIAGNGLNGIFLDKSSTNTIIGNYIGVDVNGNKFANAQYGILIQSGSNNNVIGGIAPTDSNGVITVPSNVISGNGLYGIFISGSSSNKIQGNFIGTSVDGLSGVDAKMQNLGNALGGIVIQGVTTLATLNLVGGAGNGERNVISNNGGDGVKLDGQMVDKNTVQNNYIGLKKNGSQQAADLLPNAVNGISVINGAKNNTIRDNFITRAAGGEFINKKGEGAGNIYQNNQYIGP